MKNLKELNCSDYAITTEGQVFSFKVKRFLEGWESSSGYHHVALYRDDGTLWANAPVHRLMAKTFLGPVEGKEIVNHKNGDKKDNRLSNLEWSTYKDNCEHAILNGLKPPPFLSDNSAVIEEQQIIHDWKAKGKSSSDWTEEDIHFACQLLQEGYRVCDVSSMTGMCRRYLQYLKDGERGFYRYSSQYDFSKLRKKQKLSIETIVDICKRLSKGQSQTSIAKEMGIERRVIGGIANRKTHTSISNSFVFLVNESATTIESTLKDGSE